MKVGEIITVKHIVKERKCDECGEPAQYKHTYLFQNARSDPRSTAFGHDDCSWCEDDCTWACEEHKDFVKNSSNWVADSLRWCSTFDRKRFEHMFLYKEKINE